jgi:hypothetical protein
MGAAAREVVVREINSVLSVAAWRLGVMNFLRGLVYAAVVVMGGLIALRIVQQLFAFEVPWTNVAWIAAAASVLAGLVFALIVRPGRLAVARRVDEGADLRESLSTALCVSGQGDDPWAKAAIETAVRQARGVRVAQAVPIQPPRAWPVPVALAMALGVLYFMPRVDVLGWRDKRAGNEPDKAQIVQAKQDATQAKQKVEQLVKDLELEKEPVEPPAADKPEARDPDAIRRSAIKDLTRLNDRLEQLRTGSKAMTLKAVQERLQQLRPAGSQTSELSKSLAAGEFSQAAKELEKLKEQIASGEMSAEAKQAAAKELENIAQQLKELAKNKQELEQALQQAGLDPKLAGDPKALQQALQQQAQKEGQSPEQQQQNQQLQQMAQAMSQMQSAMDGLSQAATQMAAACQNPGNQNGENNSANNASQQGQQAGQQSAASQAQQAAQQGQQQLSELEQISQDMAAASAAQQEAQQQMQALGGQCNNPGQGEGQNASQNQGQGQAGNGQCWSNAWAQGTGGRGNRNFSGTRSAGGADFELQKRRNIGQMGQGPIIGSRLVEGESIKGESVAEFSAAVASAEQGATEAMENNVIPREFHGAIKNYFGSLKENAPAKAPDAAKPAAPAQDAGKDAPNPDAKK